MSNLYEWFHDDITWCGNECSHTECERNQINMLNKSGLHSYALFKDTETCPLKEKEMRTEVHLTNEDIENIIAEKYGVKKENVHVITSKECVGYGTAEHMDYIVKGIITYPNSDTTFRTDDKI